MSVIEDLLNSYKGGVPILAPEEGSGQLELLHLLAQIRCALKLSQAKVAERMGTKQSAVSELERGLVEPGIGTFFRYVAALGLDARVFLSRRSSGTDSIPATTPEA